MINAATINASIMYAKLNARKRTNTDDATSTDAVAAPTLENSRMSRAIRSERARVAD